MTSHSPQRHRGSTLNRFLFFTIFKSNLAQKWRKWYFKSIWTWITQHVCLKVSIWHCRANWMKQSTMRQRQSRSYRAEYFSTFRSSDFFYGVPATFISCTLFHSYRLQIFRSEASSTWTWRIIISTRTYAITSARSYAFCSFVCETVHCTIPYVTMTKDSNQKP